MSDARHVPAAAGALLESSDGRSRDSRAGCPVPAAARRVRAARSLGAGQAAAARGGGGRVPAGPADQRHRGARAGEGCYAALLDRKGHMQADMRVLRPSERTRSGSTPRPRRWRRRAATSRCTRSAARSRSRTSRATRAILSLDRPAQRRARRHSPAARARQRAGSARRLRVPRGGHQPGHRPDRRDRRRRAAAARRSTPPALPRSALRRSRSSASRPARRASAPRWTAARCPPRPASSRPRSTSRRAATSARRPSPDCTTGASRTGTCAACG